MPCMHNEQPKILKQQQFRSYLETPTIKKLHAMKILHKDLHVAHIIEEVLIIAWLFAQTTFPLWARILISNMQKKIFCCVLLAGDSKYWKPCE